MNASNSPFVSKRRMAPLAQRPFCQNVEPANSPNTHTLALLREAKRNNKPIVGLFCAYVPRELIKAAGAIPFNLSMWPLSNPLHDNAETLSHCPALPDWFLSNEQVQETLNEYLDLLIADTACPNRRKCLEQYETKIPMHVLEVPCRPEEPVDYAHWLDEIGELIQALEGLTGHAISPNRLAASIALQNKERALLRAIAYLGTPHPPKLSGQEILTAYAHAGCDHTNLTYFRSILERAHKRPSENAGKLRILLTGSMISPVQIQLIEWIEENGAVVVAQENCSGLKGILQDVPEEGDPFENLARTYLDIPCACMTPNHRRLDFLDQLIGDFRPDAVIDFNWGDCLMYGFESHRLNEYVQQKWNLPVLHLQLRDLKAGQQKPDVLDAFVKSVYDKAAH